MNCTEQVSPIDQLALSRDPSRLAVGDRDQRDAEILALRHQVLVLRRQVTRVRSTEYANNRVECDHGRLKGRHRPMRVLKRERTASVIIRGHAFMQNLRRGHYELGVDARNRHIRVAAAFDELATVI